MMLAACNGGYDTSCARCEVSFTAADCARFSQAAGCTGSQTYTDTVCSPAVIGCQFRGCPTGQQVTCTAPDGGN